MQLEKKKKKKPHGIPQSQREIRRVNAQPPITISVDHHVGGVPVQAPEGRRIHPSSIHSLTWPKQENAVELQVVCLCL